MIGTNYIFYSIIDKAEKQTIYNKNMNPKIQSIW